MTPAELRTAHDALGLTADFLAERTGLHVNMIWRYEHTSRKSDVPEEVAEVVRDLQNDMACAVERLAEELLDAEELPRYVEPEDYWMAVPELSGWPRESQGMVLSRVSAAIMDERGNGTAPPIRYVGGPEALPAAPSPAQAPKKDGVKPPAQVPLSAGALHTPMEPTLLNGADPEYVRELRANARG